MPTNKPLSALVVFIVSCVCLNVDGEETVKLDLHTFTIADDY